MREHDVKDEGRGWDGDEEEDGWQEVGHSQPSVEQEFLR